jgi:putative ABC transport system substrate-binding protein
VWRVALVQHASVPVLDEGTAGILEKLAERGFRDGDTLRLTLYNAQGDIGTANTIAREVVNGPFDLVITVSTVSMQTVANANQQRKLPHVFGLVADPYSAGAGLERGQPMKHPPYLIGQGIFLPVADSFQLARQLHPGLKAVGVVWNPAESNSQAFTRKAREICQAMGIELLEANADNSAAVLEAAQSLVGRGAEAIWIGGDVTVMAGIDSVLSAARKARIPVFSITPGRPERGTLFDLGINFHECGKLAGALAADVLAGTDPAILPIRDVLDLVPRRLVVNQQAFQGLKGAWRLPPDVLRRADLVVDDQGNVQKREP